MCRQSSGHFKLFDGDLQYHETELCRLSLTCLENVLILSWSCSEVVLKLSKSCKEVDLNLFHSFPEFVKEFFPPSVFLILFYLPQDVLMWSWFSFIFFSFNYVVIKLSYIFPKVVVVLIEVVLKWTWSILESVQKLR